MRARRPASLALVTALAILVTGGVAAGGSAGEQPRCDGERATIVADRGFVRGTDGDDVIVATRRNGNVEARGGNDLICLRGRAFHEAYGEGGADRILGSHGGDNIYPGRGDDRVRGRGGRDLITDLEATGDDRYKGGTGSDRIRFSTPNSRSSKPVEVDLAVGVSSGHGHDRISAIENVEGTTLGDVLIGDRLRNVLDGVRGGDLIQGAGGDDRIRGSTVIFGEGGGTADPSAGDDPLLDGGAGDDRIFGRFGADRLRGSGGDDLLDGGGQPAGGLQGDFGNGGPGKDRCRDLERQIGCE